MHGTKTSKQEQWGPKRRFLRAGLLAKAGIRGALLGGVVHGSASVS